MKIMLNLLLALLLSSCSQIHRTPSTQVVEKWRSQVEKLHILDLENYQFLDGKIVRNFEMDTYGVKDYVLILENETEHKNINATLDCEGEVRDLRLKRHKKNKVHIPPDTDGCELLLENPDQPKVLYGVKLVSSAKVSKLPRYEGFHDECVLPDSKTIEGIGKVLLTPDYASMTCLQKVGEINTLEDPIKGMRAKTELLLGSALPEGMVGTQNPFLELDFSRAPKFETILISYLVFRGDFYGTLMSRLLKWHADQGTQVRILISNVIELDKDRKMLRTLQESSNNIKLHEYQFNTPSLNPLKKFAELHRTMHVKLFITIGEEEKNNVVFYGGRNIHDGFVFQNTPDHSAYPQLVQYGKGKHFDETYAFWRDFEMSVHSRVLAERVAAHFFSLWEMDAKKFTLKSINTNSVDAKISPESVIHPQDGEKFVRHFISTPNKERDLEGLYVDMFDNAQKSIRLSTPYFHLTKKISEALERAIDRGVKVSLITRLDLKGDTADIILSEVNKASVNKFLKHIEIHEYTEANTILHSKLLLIDGTFSFISSVNMNMRSFVHDFENGLMVYSPELNGRMNKIIDTYYDISRPITEKQKTIMWKKLVIAIFNSAL